MCCCALTNALILHGGLQVGNKSYGLEALMNYLGLTPSEVIFKAPAPHVIILCLNGIYWADSGARS